MKVWQIEKMKKRKENEEGGGGRKGGGEGGLKRLCYSNGNVGHLVSKALLPSASNGKISAASMLTLGQFFSSTTDIEEDKKDTAYQFTLSFFSLRCISYLNK